MFQQRGMTDISCHFIGMTTAPMELQQSNNELKQSNRELTASVIVI
jgi:hypothetical protein